LEEVRELLHTSLVVQKKCAMNPAGRVRCNKMAIAKGYSCASRGVFF